MAKQAAWKSRMTVNSVSLEDELTSMDLKLDQEVIDVTSFSNDGPERVSGNYSWGMSLAGNYDGASGQGDATLFAMLGSDGTATDFDPTGDTVGADNPHYTGSQVLKSYSIKASVGSAVQYSAELEGATALSRDVS